MRNRVTSSISLKAFGKERRRGRPPLPKRGYVADDNAESGEHAGVPGDSSNHDGSLEGVGSGRGHGKGTHSPPITSF